MDEDLVGADAGFSALGLRPELLQALSDLGYEEPTPIQREAIPPLLAGGDLVGQAATGTGKTAAFALPLLHNLSGGTSDDPGALVLVPTRELAEQVSQAVHRYGRALNVRVLPVYGGQPISRQLRVLERGVDVVVGTPGRVLDHIERGTLRLDMISTVVLDEADEMLDMGFAEDIEAILSETPTERQTVLFSATMPPRIDAIARKHLRNPQRIRMGRDNAAADRLPKVRQTAYLVPRGHRMTALARVLDVEAPNAAIVFCRTREEVDSVTEGLNGRGYRAEALHGGLGQEQRDRVMGRLRAGHTELLVATDVAARGLDVDLLTHVINFNLPTAPEAYVHRIGRVGRAGREGAAITLIEPRDQRLLQAVERLTGQRVKPEQLPTVADLRAKRLDLLRDTMRAAAEGDGLDQFRSLLAALTDDLDLEQIALAGLKLLHENTRGEFDETEIPSVESARERRREPRDQGSWDSRNQGQRGGRGQKPHTARGTTRVFVGLGKRAGLRPQDLVGAIAGEAGLQGRDVGAIEITDRFSLVEVPEAAADRVIKALQNSAIRGRRPDVRRERSGR
ncbi:MAG TPA: DEAD/DEAH box helicase [Actinoplanes sp.]|nr:DEAD/DEAH box helicase [Actinoplanes sp.]